MSEFDPPRTKISLNVNGARHTVKADPTALLVETLRQDLRLTGTHVGCQSARCGACLIEVNGTATKACTMLTGQAEGTQILTIEGVAEDGKLDPIQEAFRQNHALQCGYCTPGMVMAVRELLRTTPNPSDAEIRTALKGSLCRCTGYQNIVKAVRLVIHEVTADTTPSPPENTGIGAAIPRVEDERFLTGRGQYCADIDLPGQVYATFVRSELPHAEIDEIDTSAAAEMPGVIAVLTGEDVAKDEIGLLRCGWTVYSHTGAPMQGGERPILARKKVRFVGEALAVVVAERPEIADRAARAVKARLTPIAHNTVPREAQTSRELHEAAEDNLCFDWHFGDAYGTDQALASAAHVTRIDLTNNRVIPNALEPRGAIADYRRATGTATLYTTSQNPHMARKTIAETMGFIGEHELHVISPDLGGGFGSKIFIYPEECVCLWASRHLDRPIKWIGTRHESFLSDAHGRDHVSSAALALNKDGHFLALEVDTVANLGAYLSSFAAFVPTYLYGTMLAGPYQTGSIACRVRGVFTNTAPVDAYRGAGRPEATYLIETLIDAAAKELDLDPVELRRRNFIPPEAFPYQTPVALEYDVGDYEAHLTRALDMAAYHGFEARKAEAASRGRLRGIGVSCYVEACGIAPSAVAGALGADVGLWESALLRFTPSGALQVFTGAHSHGQGHETTFAQLVSERFGLPLERISIIHGDTDKTPVGMGTYGSRSLAVGGSAILKAADKIIDKGTRIAAHLLDTEPDEIVFEAGYFKARSRNTSLPLSEIVHAAYVPHDYPEDLEPGLEASAFYDPVNFTYPSGTHICEIEIDPATGEIELIAFTTVDDFGQVINPLVVDGQVHGGVAQGLGQAMMEEARYDPETGQLSSESYETYALPRATDLLDIQTDTTITTCVSNPVGAKGCGESGTIGASPAFMNAVSHALGVRLEMPATPQSVWQACQSLRGGDD